MEAAGCPGVHYLTQGETSKRFRNAAAADQQRAAPDSLLITLRRATTLIPES